MVFDLFGKRKRLQTDNQSPWVGDVLAEPGPELGEAEEDEGVGHEERVADGEAGQQGREGIPARKNRRPEIPNLLKGSQNAAKNSLMLLIC